MKVVINTCHGGFDLSYAAVMRYAELKGLKLYVFKRTDSGYCEWIKSKNNTARLSDIPNYSLKPLNSRGSIDNSSYFSVHTMERSDPILVRVVEELRKKANGFDAELKVVEIPDDVKGYDIESWDGIESIHEEHRVWA